MLNKTKIEAGARQMLEGLGVDLQNHNFATTPQRVAKVMEELFVPEETGWPVFDEEYTDIVLLRGHVFWTLCPHHMLPVKLTMSIAYLPDGKVIGASKLARIAHEANRMPMTQEALTSAILDKAEDLLTTRHKGSADTGPRGVAVMLSGNHGCFQMRGIKSCADMVTFKFSGDFEDEGWQTRFFELVRV